ncbi:MAG: carbohydrate binding family 9 domain-containing protein [Acidimicrobiia bacterium]|nr:carbohydrate binding family 9 domain-containing protein [Acidimicrobiia bacterium]
MPRIALFLLCAVALASDAAAQPPTIRAVRVDALTIDGRLDEALYREVEPISGFVQVEPNEGEPATEKTEIWVAFDRENFYVTFRNWESRPDRVVAKDMRRDGSIWQSDDIVAFLMDTFHDRRNGVQFTINSIGGRSDGQTTEYQYMRDWNAIWDFATGRFEGGWIVETAVPFKSLRYRPGEDQVWGFNAFRTNRWKNELSFLTPVPKARGQSGIQVTSMAAQLVGIAAPAGSKNLEIKPYAISTATTQAAASSRSTDLDGDFGIDVKYGVTQNLTADVTYNTDFAQVEADEQQVNLTRFSLFFPEKREFFLENQGTFQFGGVSANNFGGGASDAPILFYSRRIGLENGRAVPIEAGGRLTGRVGRYTLGVLNIQSGADATARARATNFSVVRLKRDILRRSSIGLMATGRSAADSRSGDNLAYGLDGTFAFLDSLQINTYWARTQAPGVSRDDTSYRGQLDYNGDRYGVQLEHLAIGDRFDPGVGFLRRDDVRRSFAQFRFSPRPRASRLVRRYVYQGSAAYLENGSGLVETREREAEFAVEFQNSDRFRVTYAGAYEFLPAPFRIASHVTLPVGAYEYDNIAIGFTRAQHQPLSGQLTAEYGTFYNGHRTAFSASRGRMAISARLSLDPTYSLNRVDLAQGAFTTHLLGSRITWSATPMMFTSALIQYNSSTQSLSANVRLRWEYRPGSELFVVFNEDRDTRARRFPDLANRAFIVKVNRLFRF